MNLVIQSTQRVKSQPTLSTDSRGKLLHVLYSQRLTLLNWIKILRSEFLSEQLEQP